jgi:hypothetical protein
MRQYRGQRVGALLRIAVLADPGQQPLVQWDQWRRRARVRAASEIADPPDVEIRVVVVDRDGHVICIQVVPLRDRVLITMSPGRNVNPSQRALS